MKTFNKFYTYIFVCLIYLLGLPFAYSQNNVNNSLFDSANISSNDKAELAYQQGVVDAYAQSGTDALSKLMAQNAINEQNGETDKNNYIFSFDNLPLIYTIPAAAKFAKEYDNPIFADLNSLNAHLRTLNQELANQNKPLIYLGIDNKLGFILRNTNIKGTPTYSDFENSSDKFKQIGRDIYTVYTAYYQIFDKIKVAPDLFQIPSGQNNGVEIIAFGTFLDYLIKGKTDAEIIKNAETLKANVHSQKWMFCNFKGFGDAGWGAATKNRARVYQGLAHFPASTEGDEVEAYLVEFSKSIQESLTGVKPFDSKGKFHKDSYDGTGSYVNNLASDVTEEQVLKVNALVEEMMDNALYTSYLKVGIDAKVAGGYKLTQADLIRLEKALLDLKEACQISYNAVSASYVTKVIDFFKNCTVYEDPTCLATKDSYLPPCIWNRSSTNPVTYQVAMAAGIIDGAIDLVWNSGKLLYGTGQALFKLEEVKYCWTEPGYWLDVGVLKSDNCKEVRENSKQYFKLAWDVVEFVTPPYPGTLTPELLNVINSISATSGVVADQIGKDYSAWEREILAIDNCAAYRQGKVVFDIASCFIGVGEISAAVKAGTKVASAAGGGILKVMSAFGREAGKIMGKTIISNAGATAGFVFKKATKAGVTAGLVLQFAGADMVKIVGEKALQVAQKATIEAVAPLAKVTTKEASRLAYSTVEAAATQGQSTGKIVSEIKDVALELGEQLDDKVAEQVVKSFPKDNIKIIKVDNLADQDGVIDFVMKHGDAIIATINAGAHVVKYVKKPKDNPTDPEECKVCTARVPRVSDPLCLKLLNLASKSIVNGKPAVNRLCKNIISPVTLEAVVDKVLTFTLTEADAFLTDVNENTCTSEYLCGNIGSINVDIVNAWKLEIDALTSAGRKEPLTSQYLSDWETLTTIKNMMTTESNKVNDWFTIFNVVYDTELATAKAGSLTDKVSIFAKRYSGVSCNTCGDVNTNAHTTLKNVWLNIKYAMDLYNADNNIVNVAYFSSYALFSKNYTTQHGHHHQLSDMRINLNLPSSNILGIDRNITNADKQYDLKLKGSLGNGYKEYKSYGQNLINDIALRNWGYFDQFLAYLKAPETTDMGVPNDPAKPTFQYIFNTRLQSEANIKTAFQKLFCENCDETSQPTKRLSPQGSQVFEAIWGNTGLRNNLFPSITDIDLGRGAFLNLVKENPLNNKIYGFIKSR